MVQRADPRSKKRRLWTLVWCSGVVLYCSGLQAQQAPARVLLLHSYNYTLPSSTTLADAIRKRLIERAARKIEIDAEFLDLAGAREPEIQMQMAAFFRERYARKRPAVVMTLGSEALAFAIKHRETFAPGVPVVFVAATQAAYASMRPPPDMTGTISDLAANLDNTLKLAERLQPLARQLYVVAGNGGLDREWQTIARRVIAGRERRFETTWMFGLPLDELLSAVSRIPKDAILLQMTIFVDGAGKSFTPLELFTTLAERSPAPSYSPYVNTIGKGAVGASSTNFEAMGTLSADMALQIISGKPPSEIPSLTNPAPSFEVDYKLMQRFGLRESDLLEGATLMFKEPTIWDEHRDLVLVTIGIIGLQTLFAGVLLLERGSRKRAENLLAESEERMTFTAAAVNVGLWQFDPQAGVFWATEHCRLMFCFAADVAFTRDAFVNAIHPEDRDTALAALRSIASTDRQVNHDVRIVRPNGETRWVRIRARETHRAASQLSGTVIDITDQKTAEMEAALQRQEVAHLMRVSVIGELSGAIAHEINQPLTAILANAQAALLLLPEGAPNVAEVREALQDIVHEDNRAGQVIKRLRTLLKKGETTYEPIELNEIVKTTIALLSSELIGRGVRLHVVLANNLPLTSGDPVQLQQVLINFIVNAIDAMAETPAEQRLITVSTRLTQSGGAEVAVRDRGPGLAPLQGGRVFEPFFTTKQHGLGLGLTICSTIIEAHGGALSITNSAGGGAEARFSLLAQEMLVAAQ